MFKNLTKQHSDSKDLVEKNHRYDKKVLAQGLNFYKLFWLFIIFSVFGVLIEELRCLIVLGEFESRKGLIYGPFNQVYGFGALAMILILNNIDKKRWFKLFIASAIVGAIFEYICSFLQQYILGSVSWDYIENNKVLHGRTSMEVAFIWGILGLILMCYLYPLFSKAIEKIPYRSGKIITLICTVFIIFDFMISSAAIYRQYERIKKNPPSNRIEIFLDKHYPDSFMEKIYPNMIFKT